MYQILIACSILLCPFINYGQVRSCVDRPVSKGEMTGESGVFQVNSKWTNGSTITVKFLGGSSFVQQKVEYYAHQWEKHANIKFNFINSGNADIRVSINKGGSWSYAGTEARNMGQNEPTMNYGWFNENTSEDDFRSTTLHEFGHALGLLHEHNSPFSKIKWNLQKVYAYYMQTQGWSKEQVDQQVINRYSVTMSNKVYDPISIMHYPIDPSLTIDNYSVGWNTNLSAGDKSLIAELYPYSKIKPFDPGDPITVGGAASSKLDNFDIEHNVFENGKIGMRIKASFQISNSLNKSCFLGAYFYMADGRPLKDIDNTYRATNGNVSVGKRITPMYQLTTFTGEQLFLPYDELHMLDGKFNLKVSISIFDSQSREIVQSGAAYFSYRKGALFSTIQNVTTFDNKQQNIIVMPKFSVENAKGQNYQAVTYVHFKDGRQVLVYNNVTQRNEPMVFSTFFTPLYDNTTYNFGYYSDLFVYIPYTSFRIYNQTTDYKLYTAFFKDGKQVATSTWTDFYLKR